MPPNKATAIEARARVYSYASGPSGDVAARAVAVETPVNLVFGGVPFAVMMATPADLEDFAYGFCLTEGVIERPVEIRGVAIEAAPAGLKLNIALDGERLSEHLARGRAMSGRTGCGLCGIDDLARLPKARVAAKPAKAIAPAAIKFALDALGKLQPLNQATRAVHGAAWCDRSGAVVALREDVGRHNALDKVIGAMLRAGQDPSEGFFVITSRCSFEMVAKAAAFGAHSLVALSAPTSLALELADASGLNLIAIARADHALVFDAGGRLAKGEIAA